MRVTEVASQHVTTRYFHADHLGSIPVITNDAGAVVERLSYDAWSKRCHPKGALLLCEAAALNQKKNLITDHYLHGFLLKVAQFQTPHPLCQTKQMRP